MQSLCAFLRRRRRVAGLSLAAVPGEPVDCPQLLAAIEVRRRWGGGVSDGDELARTRAVCTDCQAPAIGCCNRRRSLPAVCSADGMPSRCIWGHTCARAQWMAAALALV